MRKDLVKITIAEKNLSRLFERAAVELAEILSQDQDQPAAKSMIIRVRAVDINSLLYEWLNQLLKVADEYNLIVKKVKIVEMTEVDLSAELEFSESKAGVMAPGSLSSDIDIKEKKSGFEVRLVFE